MGQQWHFCTVVLTSLQAKKEQWRCVIAGDVDALSIADAAVINENIYLSDLDTESRKNFEMLMLDQVARAHGLPPPPNTHQSGDSEAHAEVKAFGIAPLDSNLLNSTWRASVADVDAPSCPPVALRIHEAPNSAVTGPSILNVIKSESHAHLTPIVPASHTSADVVTSATPASISNAFDAYGLEPEVKALAMSLHALKLGLKKHCAEYAVGLALQGVLNVDDLRRVSEADAWAIIKRAGFKVVPQQVLMRQVFGQSAIDPDLEAEDRFALVVPQEQIAEKNNLLKVRMEAQKLRIQNDQSEPLTDEQRATLHPEVQRMSEPNA